MAQLWGGRFTKETDKLVYNFNASISFDQKFYSIQYDRIYHASAVCPGTCCLYPCFHRRTSRSMVVFPHCGDHFSDRVRSFPGCHKQNDHSKNSGGLRTSKLPIPIYIKRRQKISFFPFRISSVFFIVIYRSGSHPFRSVLPDKEQDLLFDTVP